MLTCNRRIPGTAARVWDNDGEFLLMEAAYALPRWLKPETASSRVWLLDGLLHIVPLPTAAAPDIPSFPSLKQAKQIVHSSQIDTVAGTRLPDFGAQYNAVPLLASSCFTSPIACVPNLCARKASQPLDASAESGSSNRGLSALTSERGKSLLHALQGRRCRRPSQQGSRATRRGPRGRCTGPECSSLPGRRLCCAKTRSWRGRLSRPSTTETRMT